MSAAEAKENEVETSTESSPKLALMEVTKSKTTETSENEDTPEKNEKDDDSNDIKQDNENEVNELVGNNENEEEEDEDDDIKMDKNNDKNKNQNKKRKRDEDVNVNGDNGEPSKKKIKKSARNDNNYPVKDILCWTFSGGKCLYKVEWDGYPNEEDQTWEPIQNVAHNEKFMKFIQNLQTTLVKSDEGGLLKTIRELAPDELKARLIERASDGDAYDKIALKQLFKIEPVDCEIL